MALVRLDLDPPPLLVRRFGVFWLPLVLGVIGFRVATGWPWWAFALTSIVVTLVVPRAMRGLVIALSVITWPIALVTSTFLLALVYFGVVTPLGLAARIFGHDPLPGIDRRRASYWTERPKESAARRRYFDPY